MIKITVNQRDINIPDEYEVVAWVRSKNIGSINLQIRSDYLIENTHTRCGIIKEIKIDPDYRMQGVAQQMLKEAMAKLAQEKVDLAVIENDSDKLLKLSERVGFVKLPKQNILIASVGNKMIFDLLRQNSSD